MDFPGRLKILRVLSQKTQEKVSLDCGHSGQSWIGNYERGGRLPRLDEIEDLAHALLAPARALVSTEDMLNHVFPSRPARLDESTLVAAAEQYIRQKRFPANSDELLAVHDQLLESPNVSSLPTGNRQRGERDGLDAGASGRTTKAAGSARGRRAK